MVRAAYDADRWQDAGRLFLLAADYADDERARTNAAIGYELVGQPDRALSLARAVTKDFPCSPRPWAVICRVSPDTVTASELENELPPAAQVDEGTLIALAMRAARAEDWPSSERFAATAVEREKEWAAPLLILAEAKLRHAVQGAYRPAIGRVITATTDALAESLKYFDRAVDAAATTRAGWLFSRALLERARARDWSGDDKGTEADYYQALTRFPDDPHVLLSCGRRFLSLGRTSEAISLLRNAVSAAVDDPESKHFLAVAFRVERQPAENWLTFAVQAAESPNWRHQLDAIDLALGRFATLGRHDDALKLIDRLQDQGSPAHIIAATRAIAFRDAGDLGISQHHAIEAAEALPPSAPADERRFVAEAQLRAGRDEVALRLFEQVASETRQAPDVWQMVRVARKLERWDLILRTAAAWREAGARDDDLAEAELAVLEFFAPPRSHRTNRGGTCAVP